MQQFKRILSTAVTITTISWSIGVGTLLPLATRAAAPTLGGGGPTSAQMNVPVEAVIDINSTNENLNTQTVNQGSVELKKCDGATDANSCTTPTGSNLCTSVALGADSRRITCSHAAPLDASTTYRFRLTTGIQNTGGPPEALAAEVIRIFRTSSFGGQTNTTPPQITSQFPPAGTQGLAINGKMGAAFSQGPESNLKADGTATAVNNLLNVSLKKIVNFQPTTEVLTNVSQLTWDATRRELLVSPPTLEANTEYDFCIRGTVQNQQNQPLGGDRCTRLKTGGTSDTSGPGLRATTKGGATSPANAATAISTLRNTFLVFFAEALDPSTVTVANIHLCRDTNNSSTCNAGDTILTNTTTELTGTYDDKILAFTLSPLAVLPGDTGNRYCFEVTTNVKDLVGNSFDADSSTAGNQASTDQCFTIQATTDTTAPKLSFVDADNFKLVAHFTEGLTPGAGTNGVENPANYTLTCPVDAQGNGPNADLTGKTIRYRPDFREVTIEGLRLPNGQTCRLTAANTLRDLAGNNFAAAPDNRADFKVQDAGTTKGQVGTAPTGDFHSGTDFAKFQEHPSRCQPRASAINKATAIDCEFSLPQALTTGASFVLTFPTEFTLTNATAPAATASFFNKDVNGPGPGVTTITAVTADNTAGTVTVTLAHTGDAMGTKDHVHFELSNITNPGTPLNGLRVSIIVKDSNSVKVGQTIQAAPFNIQQGGGLSISGKVCKGTSSGGACGADTFIANAKVVCDQRGAFQVGTTTAAFMGLQEATTNGQGEWTISGLTSGEYNCFLPPDPITFADTGGTPPRQSVQLSSTNKTGVDFKLKNMDATATDSRTLTINISGGPANEVVDVFCHAGGFDFEFSAPTMKAVTLTADGTHPATAPILKLQQNKSYECGLGPHIAFEQFANGGPPPVPTFTFMPPKPQRIVMDANKTVTFALQKADRTITGTVVDGSSTGIANVFVHAAPLGCFGTDGAFTECHGAFGQTKSDGTFSLAVDDGTYEVGADGPGLPPSTRQIANVKGANVTGLTLTMVKSSTTISGTVQDESGNGIKYAHVSAERRTITSGADACDFANSRPSGGFADTPTDANGNFTLYVANGTWCIRAFSPAYGQVGTKTVTMSSTSLTGQNIAATAANFGTISGTITKAGTNVSGAFVNCFGSNGGNQAQSNSSGAYSMKVKLASSGTTTLTCDGFAPGVGPLGRGTVTFASGDTTKTQNFTLAGNPGTITITATGLTEGFCDARDATTGLGSGAPIVNGTATINAPAGTYTVRCNSPKIGQLQVGSIEKVQTITAGGTASITATIPTLRSVTGRITDGTSSLEGATATFTNTATKSSFTVVTGNQSGTNNNLLGTSIPEGDYRVTVTKKGFEPAATTATVSGGNLTMSAAVALTPTTTTSGETVTIPVQESAAAYTGEATVIATKDGKTVVGEIDATTGNASLDLTNGTWTVKAIGDNGKESSTSTVTVTNGALSGSAPTLSLATEISGYTAKSESSTFALSSGGLLKFNDLAVGSTAPEVNIPANTFSTTDSSNGKVEMKSDPTLASVDPGTDQNVVGKTAYDITPKDANGNKIADTQSPVTITIPYTDADVTAAGVDESKLTVASFNTSSQTWESLPTTVDTVNNLLICNTEHFSSFGILGGVKAAQSASDKTPPATPTNVSAKSANGNVTLTWTDPTDTDLSQILVLRNRRDVEGTVDAISGNTYASVTKGTGTYTDTRVTAGKTYKYILRSEDTSGNINLNLAEVSVTVAAATPPPATTTPPPATTTPPPATTTPPPATTTPPPAQAPTVKTPAPPAGDTTQAPPTAPAAPKTAVEKAQATVDTTKAAVTAAKTALADAKAAVKDATKALKAANKSRDKDAIAEAKAVLKEARQGVKNAQRAVTKVQTAYKKATKAAGKRK